MLPQLSLGHVAQVIALLIHALERLVVLAVVVQVRDELFVGEAHDLLAALVVEHQVGDEVSEDPAHGLSLEVVLALALLVDALVVIIGASATVEALA